MIAAVLAKLPKDLGGRTTALRVAELARAGQAEDWGRDVSARCIPVAWRGENQAGPQAVAEVIGHEPVSVRGRMREFLVRWCRVT